jgi:hypothetical protein
VWEYPAQEVEMLQRLRAWLGRDEPEVSVAAPPDDDRTSGEDVLEGLEDETAEATPSDMNRLKTDKL